MGKIQDKRRKAQKKEAAKARRVAFIEEKKRNAEARRDILFRNFKPRCTFCDKIFEGEEITDPYTNSSGDPICDECHEEHYTFRCAFCEEEEDIDVKDENGGVLAVMEEEEVFDNRGNPLEKGLYLIDRKPFNMNIYKRIADLPEGDYYGEIDGSLCRYCAEKAKRKAVLFRRFN